MHRDGAVVRLLLVALAAVWVIAWGQRVVPVGPPHDSGQGVTAAFEGWFPNADGTFSLLFGYYNRNNKEEPDIAVGPENKIEPGPVDQGQPTHFLARRQWGVFTVSVPKDFGSKKVTWTITANGESVAIPASLDPLWEVNPFKDATNNTPPFIGFSEKGPFVQGPRGQSVALTAAVQQPLELRVWVADDANVAPGAPRPRTPPVVLTWSQLRGPGKVIFSSERPMIEEAEFAAPPNTVFHGKSATTATFSAAGEYVLRVAANDWSGEGGRGFQCCWSNAQVKVTVK
jgi:hypothetical protein